MLLELIPMLCLKLARQGFMFGTIVLFLAISNLAYASSVGPNSPTNSGSISLSGSTNSWGLKPIFIHLMISIQVILLS